MVKAKHHLFSNLLFLLLCGTLFAEPAIQYVEGSVDINFGDEWVEALIGDELGFESRIRLEKGAFVELVDDGRSIFISQAGIYTVGSLFSQASRVNRRNVGSLIVGKIRSITHERPRGPSTAMGVRGDDAMDEAGIAWEEGDEDLKGSAELIEKGDLHAAIKKLEDDIQTVLPEERAMYLYYLATANVGLGNVAKAVEYVREMPVVWYLPIYRDALLLKGQLLIETLAFDDALELFNQHLRTFPDEPFSQGIQLLAALCYDGMGDIDKAKMRLKMAINLDPESEIAEEARRILGSL